MTCFLRKGSKYVGFISMVVMGVVGCIIAPAVCIATGNDKITHPIDYILVSSILGFVFALFMAMLGWWSDVVKGIKEFLQTDC